MMRQTAIVGIGLVVLLGSGPVRGQEKEDPNTLFNRGLDLAREGRAEDAIALWLGILDEVEAQHRPSVHRALGLAYAQMDRLPEASYHLRRFLAAKLTGEAAKSRARLLEVEDRLRQEHRSVTLACQPRDSTVYMGPEAKGPAYACPVTWWFKPGRHFVHVTRPGYTPATEEIDVADQCTETLRTVVLQAEAGAVSSGAVQDPAAVAARLKQAIQDGHVSVVRQIAASSPAVLKGLPCDQAWLPAMKKVSLDDCASKLVSVLVDAGVSICIDQGQLESAVEVGCAQTVLAMLPFAPVDVIVSVARFANGASVYPRGQERWQGFMTALDAVTERTRQACAAEGPGSDPCKALESATEHLDQFVAGVSVRAQPADLVAFLAANPELALRNQCRMVKEALGWNSSEVGCTKAMERIALFYQKGPKECSLADQIQDAMDLRCPELVALLAADAMPEDVAAASRQYNRDGRFSTATLTGGFESWYLWAVEVGNVLAKANQQICARDGEDSPNCAARLYVEAQVKKLQDEKKRQESPQYALDKACLIQGELDVTRAALERQKKIARESGVPSPNVAELITIVTNLEANLEAATKHYKKASGKAYRPALCK